MYRLTLLDAIPAPRPAPRGYMPKDRHRPSRKIRNEFSEVIATADLPANDFRRILRHRWEASRVPQSKGSDTMGYLIRPVASTAPVAVAVPDELAKEMEELFAHLTKNPGQLAFVEFEDETTQNDAGEDVTTTGAEQREQFVKYVKSWAANRTVDDKPAPVVFRQGKTTDLPDNQLRFRLSAPLTPEQEAEAKHKRELAKAKREAKAKADAKASK